MLYDPCCLDASKNPPKQNITPLSLCETDFFYHTLHMLINVTGIFISGKKQHVPCHSIFPLSYQTQNQRHAGVSEEFVQMDLFYTFIFVFIYS